MLKKVALVGATGALGTEILEALVGAGFVVTAIKRKGSLSVPARLDKVKVVQIPATVATGDLGGSDSGDGSSGRRSIKQDVVDTWTEVLRGHDACVVAFQTRNVELHLSISEAAAAAGVKRIIPADFGSCDSSSVRAMELVPLFSRKARIRDELTRLAEVYPEFSWTSIVTGHFFDWGLANGFMHFDLESKKAMILGDGSHRASASTLKRVGQAVARVLQKPDLGELKNRMIFIQSFCVTEMDILQSLEKACGDSNSQKWHVTYRDADEYIEEQRVALNKGSSDAVENLVFALGAIEGNWEERDGFAMKVLDLENENLDDVVAHILKEARLS